MAYTARKEADVKEFFDDPSELQQKIKTLAELIKNSNHMIAYTGAGISTSCGIADFRSGINTVLDTGAGKWAKEAAVQEGKLSKDELQNRTETKKMSTFKAVPSASHMALVALARAGLLKHLVSQNTDGLHRRSGFPIDQLSELHGNSTLEECPLCCKVYMRDFRCRDKSILPKGGLSRLKYVAELIKKSLANGTIYASKLTEQHKNEMLDELNKTYEFIRTRNKSKSSKLLSAKQLASETKLKRTSLQTFWDNILSKYGLKCPRYMHHTGRYCTVKHCGGELGQLQDTIINFGESLPVKPLKDGNKAAASADLCLVLGSSCTVTPAADMPRLVGEKWEKEMEANGDKVEHHLVICNLQKTPLHSLCGLPLFSKIDDVMIGVMKELELEIPKFYLQRYMKIEVKYASNTQRALCISGIDLDGTPFTLFKAVVLKNNGERIRKIINNKENKEHEYNYIVPVWDKKVEEKSEGLTAELTFCGNYEEPKLKIVLNEYLVDCVNDDGVIVLKMIMDPMTKIWNVPNKKEQTNDKNVQSLWRIEDENDDHEVKHDL